MRVVIIAAVVLFAIWLSMKLLIRIVPIFMRFLLYCVITIPLWTIILLSSNHLFGVVLTVYLLYRATVKSWNLNLPLIADLFTKRSGSSTSGSADYSGGSYGNYVLNKKSGVIHDASDSSADTISERHKVYLSYSEASQLVSKGGRYRFKEESE